MDVDVVALPHDAAVAVTSLWLDGVPSRCSLRCTSPCFAPSARRTASSPSPRRATLHLVRIRFSIGLWRMLPHCICSASASASDSASAFFHHRASCTLLGAPSAASVWLVGASSRCTLRRTSPCFAPSARRPALPPHRLCASIGVRIRHRLSTPPSCFLSAWRCIFAEIPPPRLALLRAVHQAPCVASGAPPRDPIHLVPPPFQHRHLGLAAASAFAPHWLGLPFRFISASAQPPQLPPRLHTHCGILPPPPQRGTPLAPLRAVRQPPCFTSVAPLRGPLFAFAAPLCVRPMYRATTPRRRRFSRSSHAPATHTHTHTPFPITVPPRLPSSPPAPPLLHPHMSSFLDLTSVARRATPFSPPPPHTHLLSPYAAAFASIVAAIALGVRSRHRSTLPGTRSAISLILTDRRRQQAILRGSCANNKSIHTRPNNHPHRHCAKRSYPT